MSQPPYALTPYLWVAQSDFFATNSGVFVSRGQAVLVDPAMRPDEIDRLGRLVAELGVAAGWLVLTHSHWDHVLGPERLPGVPVVAQARYREVAAHDAAGIGREIARWEAQAGLTRSAPFVLPQPDLVFDAEHALVVGELRLRLLAVPGHAPDQLALYAPEAGCLWAADMLSDVEIPFVSHRLDAYEQSLDKLAALDLHVLVPGHGQPTLDQGEIRARVRHDQAYLAELRERVASVVGRGQPLQAAIEACAGMRFRQPQANAGPHRLNVESAYLELGGAADPRRVGWNQDWTLKEDQA